MLKLVAGLAAAAMVIALTQVAHAAPGVARGDVNLRTGPGTKYARIATIPAGSRVDVLQCARWCQVIYAGRRGWASASYIARGYPQRVFRRSTECYEANVWRIPGCEWPIERSVREFNQNTRDYRNRQHGGKKR
ncbi:SH3 domain-containing protein [Bauldia litoralis]|uniref:Uncharacterized conserved protein YraI n=1 Tax=Bauldia litoralis TaxID=665467 RepID=A0A1G6BA47_9HYPH|nr:SH3 domain-containing protein [Bauldia litoralis]SDB17353.1 Uncharacterized conserved protein YraI [Bauldia litoralis]